MSVPTTPEGFPIDTCRSCGRDVVWAITKRQKLMPVDVEPTDDGTISLVPGALGRGVAAVVVKEPTLEPMALRTSHFATCPQADKWRRLRTARQVPGT